MPTTVIYRIEVDGLLLEEREVAPEDDATGRPAAIRTAAAQAQLGHEVAVYRRIRAGYAPSLIYFAPRTTAR